MRPTVGRDVHYVAYGTPGGEYKAGAHRAGKVTEVREDIGGDSEVPVSLVVFNPTGQHYVFNIPYDGSPDPAPGTWHWPERV